MNVLILTANYGAGHIKASEAIKEQLKSRNLDFNVTILNLLDYVNHNFNKLTTSWYSETTKKLPNVYGKIYYYTEEDHLPSTVFSLILKSLSNKCLPVINKFNPDVIISNHPFPTEIVSHLKCLGELQNIKLITMLTDYAPHKYWIHDHVDAYITATEQMNEDMVARGVNKDIIYPIGIPVGVKFMNKYSKSNVFPSITFDEDSFTVLLMCGSLGVESVIKVFKRIITLNKRMQIIIVTGNNSYLYKKFKKIISNCSNKNIKFHLLGYTKDIDKFMSVSDVIVTKPGGLTTTEAIFSNLPIIFFDAVPGQEEKNAEFILRNNIGMRISNSDKDLKLFEDLIEDKVKLDQMRKNMLTVKKHNFLDNLVSMIEKICV